MRSIPEHDAAERRVLAARLERDVDQRRGVDVAGRARGRRGQRADVDLDVLVRRDRLRPGVPRAEVPGVGIVVVGQAAGVVVELDVDRVEGDGVQDSDTSTLKQSEGD